MGQLDLTTAQVQNVLDNSEQWYLAYITNYYNFDGSNTTQQLIAGEWQKLQPTVSATFDHRTAEALTAAPAGYNYNGNDEFTCAGLKAGSHCTVRILSRFSPDVDESQAQLRLNFTTNSGTTIPASFEVVQQSVTMTQGADVWYTDENLITFFVGDTLAGDTIADAGYFQIDALSSVDATLEILGVTLSQSI